MQRSSRSRTRKVVSFIARVNSSHPKRSCAFFISRLLETEFPPNGRIGFRRQSLTGRLVRHCFLVCLFLRRVVRQHGYAAVGVQKIETVGELLLLADCSDAVFIFVFQTKNGFNCLPASEVSQVTFTKDSIQKSRRSQESHVPLV